MKKWLREYEVPLIILAVVVVIFLGVFLLASIGNPTVSGGKDDKTINNQTEELVIDILEPCDYGTLTVLDRDNDVLYQYSGKINIKNDGKDGEKIEIIVKHP